MVYQAASFLVPAYSIPFIEPQLHSLHYTQEIFQSEEGYVNYFTF